MNKADALTQLKAQHRQLLELVQDFAKADFEVSGAMGTWTPKDMFAHLAYWNWEAKRAIELVLKGERPSPWLDVNASQIEEANQQAQAKQAGMVLFKVMDDYRRSHKALSALVERTSEAEWSKAVPFASTAGETANAEWVSRGVIEHYEEHVALFEQFLEERASHST